MTVTDEMKNETAEEKYKLAKSCPEARKGGKKEGRKEGRHQERHHTLFKVKNVEHRHLVEV